MHLGTKSTNKKNKLTSIEPIRRDLKFLSQKNFFVWAVATFIQSKRDNKGSDNLAVSFVEVVATKINFDKSISLLNNSVFCCESNTGSKDFSKEDFFSILSMFLNQMIGNFFSSINLLLSELL